MDQLLVIGTVGAIWAWLVLPAALRVTTPRGWYNRLRYGHPRPLIILDAQTGTMEIHRFHRRGMRRVLRSVYLLSDTFPPRDGQPGLVLVHCPRDLMPFLVGDDTAGWLIEHG